MKNINIKNINNYLIQENNCKWIVECILYSSYNSVLLIPVLISLKEYIIKEKNIKIIAIISSVIIMLLMICIFFILINVDVNINELEMPAVYAINKFFPQVQNIYGVIILMAIFTTAISLGMSFLKNVSVNKKQYDVISVLICLTGVIASKIGFSNLVNLFYPILGILGLIQIVKIIY